jgi:uncharacterized membrane protein YGL010W
LLYQHVDRALESAMRSLTDQLATYAAYHRDKRNIATHFIGIPLIVLALGALLSRPAWTITPAHILFGLATLYYLCLDLPLGIGMGVVSIASVTFGQWVARQATPTWLAIGIALFVVGWAFQFIGHVCYEHRKPAFVDDVIGLLIGPLFILVELLFGLGLRRDLHDAIETRFSTR